MLVFFIVLVKVYNRINIKAQGIELSPDYSPGVDVLIIVQTLW